MALILLWLNGPGLRLLAPRVVSYFAGKLGIQSHFRVEGSFSGGLIVRDLQIKAPATIGGLRIARVEPEYRWRELLRGRLDGLSVVGGRLDLVLGATRDDKPTDLDLRKFAETARALHSRLAPMRLEISDVSVVAKNLQGAAVFQLSSSEISHRPGSDAFSIKLGAITDAEGRVWSAQESSLLWRNESLEISKIDPLPGVSLQQIQLQLPVVGEASAELQVRVDDAVFAVTFMNDFKSARLDLVEGSLDLPETWNRLGVALPIAAKVSSFSLELENLWPETHLVEGNCRVLLENLTWEDWNASELNLDGVLQANDSSITGRGMIQESEFLFNTRAALRRSGERGIEFGEIGGDFSAVNFPALLKKVATAWDVMDGKVEPPASLVRGDFTVAHAENQVLELRGNIALVPEDAKTASSLNLSGLWRPDGLLETELTTDGIFAKFSYQQGTRLYQASADFKEFASERYEPWLRAFKWKSADRIGLTGSWRGNGDLAAGTHRGELVLRESEWRREGAILPLEASGDLRYNWPQGVESAEFRLSMGEQTLGLRASVQQRLLTVRDWAWSRQGQELAQGTASLPMPADLREWRALLDDDQRPIHLSIQSQEPSLGQLKEWIPALARLDERSTGKLQVKLAGTYAKPSVFLELEASQLRSSEHPDLPPAELGLTLRLEDGTMRLEGSVSAPDFPPARLAASMPFSPHQWLVDRDGFMRVPVEGKLDLPELDLSRFASILPGIEQISGRVKGNCEVSGELGDPKILGEAELVNVSLGMKNPRVPKFEGLSATLELNREAIALRKLTGRVAGGNFTGEGLVKLEAGKLGEMDFRLRADHAPVLRNDLFLLRVNADLRLRGAWERAVLSGSVESVDSIFYRDIQLLPIGTPFAAQSATALPKLDAPIRNESQIPEPFRNWGLDVSVAAVEPLIIRGNLANGDVTGRMQLGGTIGKPAPQGKFTLRNFTASLPFSKLVVQTGTAIFTPEAGFDPILEIRGTANPRPYRVTGYVYGRASDPQLVLTSNPPLPDHEIMTLLASGTTTSGLENPQAASARALQLFVEELRRGRFRVGKSLRPVLTMLDRVDFSLAEADPYTSESFSTATLSITDRWFLSAGVGATGDTRVLAIWRLTFH